MSRSRLIFAVCALALAAPTIVVGWQRADAAFEAQRAKDRQLAADTRREIEDLRAELDRNMGETGNFGPQLLVELPRRRLEISAHYPGERILLVGRRPRASAHSVHLAREGRGGRARRWND